MSFVLTTGSKVECGHKGAVSTEGTAKLKVGGKPVLLKAGVAGKSVAAACTIQNTSDQTGPLTVKCTTVTSVTGEAGKLKVAGKAVLLDTLAGGTDGMKSKGTLESALTADPVQRKLKAV